MNNLITTIIPTYNRSSLLKKTVRNVLSQNNLGNIIISIMLLQIILLKL